MITALFRAGSKRLATLPTAILLALTGMFAGSALATSPPEFEVNGNTISFGYQDWYQVQSSSDYSTLCQGYDECTVPDGTYIIINHTIHERFLDVQVGGSAPISGGAGVIVFQDEGWYQVQNSTTYETVCEGGIECTVSAGTYIVINHTTGVRTIEVVAGDGGDGVSNDDFILTGNLVTFNTSDWFQVQSTSDYQTVCEGSAPCNVSDGNYIVINHSTGQRWDNISVSGGGGVISSTAVINGSNYRDIVKQAFEVFSGQAFDDRLSIFPYFQNSSETGNSRGELNLVCANGGTHRQFLQVTPASIDSMEGDFADCLWSIAGIGEGDTLNGSIEDNYNPGGHRRNFSTFSSRIDSESRMEVDGEHRTGCCSPGVAMETTDLDYFFTYPGGTLKISDSNTLLLRAYNMGFLRGGFTMQANATDLNDVQVATETDLRFDEADTDIQGTQRHLWNYTTGQLRLVAPDDGSSIVINADTGDYSTVNVVISNAGESINRTESWGDWQTALHCKRDRCGSFTVPGDSEVTTSYY